ncbi:MAG: hypothetical protein KDA87_01715 [Planctomycetales bacterium]|nr:hypothetical protein [Planctomycetales bacterium]
MIIGLGSDGVSVTDGSTGFETTGAQDVSEQPFAPTHAHESLLGCLAQDEQLPPQLCRMGWRYAFHAIFS